jgi:enoyl-CoA hydratase/carnithine racemase
MALSVVKLERLGEHVAPVTIVRESALNGANGEVAGPLDGIVAETESDSDIRAVVHTGVAEAVFCAGVDWNFIKKRAPRWTGR